MAFLTPDPPAAPKAVEVPSKKRSASELREAAERDKQKRFSQRGRAATMLTGGQGVQGDDSTGFATKQLLGG